MATEAFAPAKVNLTLHVTGQRSDGYHLLDSLVAFADVGDRVTVSAAADRLSLVVVGPQAGGVPVDDSNLVLKAARFLGVTDAAITLDKQLPAAAGIGGGSSDAAAALRALSALTGRPLPADRGLALGADVPVCLAAHAMRMGGIGEVLTPVPALPPVWCVLANPGVGVATPAVFRALHRRDNPAMPTDIPAFACARDLAVWLATQRNDLQAPAVALAPVIAPVLAALADLPGALLSRMSGSGATCFALFENGDQARAGAETLAGAHPGWWVRAAALS
ncbi:4-(cytidine 5'-diphospho)-2-C-methyl-D-erythritol kinase [Actibacterium sp. D379-3]